MRTELGERLDDLATQAPPALSADGLWDRGRRRGRARRAAAILAVVLAAGAALGAAQVIGGLDRPGPQPADQKHSGHLPRTIYPPAPWSKGTAETGAPGRLAFIGDAARIRPKGWSGRFETTAAYGISAVDGTVSFLDLPVDQDVAVNGLYDQALSPDGSKVAFVRLVPDRSSDTGSHAIGWGIYDTGTGKTVNLTDKAVPRPAEDGFQPAFTAGGRFLLTDYPPEGSTGTRDHKLVAWDARTGASRVLEPAGNYWVPEAVSDPIGISWARDNKVHRILLTPSGDASARVSTVTLDHEVVAATFGPDGKAFAYIGGTLTADGIDGSTWKLYGGVDTDHLKDLDVGSVSGTMLGWRDATHVVVVGETWKQYWVVDVTDGSTEQGRVAGPVNFNNARFASDLWVNDLVPGVRPPHAGDPRSTPKKVGLGLVLTAAAGGLLVFWRRRRG